MEWNWLYLRWLKYVSWFCDALWTLWHSDAKRRHIKEQSFVQVMALCRKATRHYLSKCWLISIDQCWLIIPKVLWHSKGIFIEGPGDTNQENKIEMAFLKSYLDLPGTNELRGVALHGIKIIVLCPISSCKTQSLVRCCQTSIKTVIDKHKFLLGICHHANWPFMYDTCLRFNIW